MKKIIIILIFPVSILQAEHYYQNNKKVDLALIKEFSRTSQNIDYYTNMSGLKMGVTDKLIVKLKEKAVLSDYLSEFNLTLQMKLSKNLFLLKSQNKSLTLNISNSLHEKNNVEFAHPDFIKKRVKR